MEKPWTARSRDRRFTGNKHYEIKGLWERQHAVLRGVALGLTNSQVAEIAGVHSQTVSNLRNSELGQDRITFFRNSLDAETISIAKRIQDFAPTALELLEQIIEGKYEGASLALRAKYAHAHLARAGYGEVQKVHSVNTHLTPNELQEIKERAIRAAREAGISVLEAECTPLNS